MSRQDCNKRPKGSVMRLKMPAKGINDVLNADAQLCKNVASGTTTPLCSAASKGFSSPSEMPITNPISRGRNKPAVTNLCNALKPITKGVHRQFNGQGQSNYQQECLVRV